MNDHHECVATLDPAMPIAIMGDRVLTDLVDCTSDLAALDSSGFWAVLVPSDGDPVCARFASQYPTESLASPGVVGAGNVTGTGRWPGLGTDAEWMTSLGEGDFVAGVTTIRERIAAGDVYQVNLTRRLETPIGGALDVVALGAALARGNPAPYGAVLSIPAAGVAVASASPERFLTRQGRSVWSSPIKGTAATADGFLDKDRAENVMIVDLVRNDLGRVCEWGSVTVPALCAVEEHPGLAHLVSTVRGTLRPGVGWPELLDATFPPGSVTGAPKLAAVGVIAELEPVPRGPYCGALGWVDADRGIGDLGVTIRTFWVEDGHLCFGTGGGITWGSDPAGEWAETELKAAHLLQVATRPG